MSNKLTTTWSRWLVLALLVLLPAIAATAQDTEDDAGPFVAVWSWVEERVGQWLREWSLDSQEFGAEPEPCGQEFGGGSEPCGQKGEAPEPDGSEFGGVPEPYG